MLKFIDLFSGIGGFRVALEARGLECVFSCEIDKHAQNAYHANFGEKPAGDITTIAAKNIPRHDVLCAGFPCQPFSISGSRGGTADPRGRLFYEIIRIMEYHKPRIVLLENVKNILTIDNGKVMKDIGEKLAEEGYHLHHHLLNASHFGVPQARERVYFVAIRQDLPQAFRYHAPLPTHTSIYLEDILESSIAPDFFVRRDDMVFTKNDTLLAHALKPLRVGQVNKGGQGERIYSAKGHAITQSAYGGGVGARTGLYQTPEGVRRLTINECKAVMGFPLDYKVSAGVQGYQQLGNAVVPAMIGQLWDRVKGLAC